MLFARTSYLPLSQSTARNFPSIQSPRVAKGAPRMQRYECVMNDPRRIFRVPLFPLRRIERLRNELTTVAATAAIVVTPSTQGQAGRTVDREGGERERARR